MRIQSSKAYYWCFSDTWGLCKESKRKLCLLIMRILPEHHGHQSSSQCPKAPEQSSSQILSPVLSHVPSVSSVFCCTSTKWHHCVVVWNIQCVEWTVKYLLWECKEQNSAWVRRKASGDWCAADLKTDEVVGCGRSFGDTPWWLTWTLFNGLILPPVDMLTVLQSLVPRGSLWLRVYVPWRSFDYLFYWTDLAGNGIHSNCCTWISQLPLNIYTCEWQSGTNEAFCLLYIWDFFVYSVCCKACGINSLNIEVSTAACSGIF